MDEMEYLQPSFDPSSLTMAQLRNILMTHDIKYPSSGKKLELVDIFTQELKPKGRRLLAARDRVRRTSEGITNVPSNESSQVGDDKLSMPPPSVPTTPGRRKSKKSGRSSAADDSAQESAPTTSTKSAKRASSKQPKQSDTETDQEYPKATPSRSHKSEGRRKLKDEEPEETPRRLPSAESAFSDENPFQSGSSPADGEPPRRKSAGPSSEKRKSTSVRRKTDGSYMDNASAPSSRSIEMPVSVLKKRLKREDEVQAGEEFTPEEQSELAVHGDTRGQSQALTRRTAGSSRVPRSAPWVVLTSLLVGCATWYRQEKLAVGYCGIGRPVENGWSVQVPEWASFLEPTCEPCPQHATCFEGLETICDPDFILVHHPLSVSGLLPIPPSCEPDGEKVRKVNAVADRAVEALRQRKAEAECGTAKDGEGHLVSAEISEADLKKEVSSKRRKGMGKDEFEELWKGAIGEVVGREEVVSSQDTGHLSSTSLSRLPIGCAIRRSARLTLARHRQFIAFVIFVIFASVYGRNRIVNRRADAARIPSLVSTTLDRLATQATLYARGDAAEAWISAGQLRDDILRDLFSHSRRESMWARVRDIVEKNANVRASVREGRGGEVSRMWEWIGSVGFIDDSSYLDGRRSGGGGKRVSFGVLDQDDSINGGPPTPDAGGQGKEMVEKRKWDEGRPIY